MPTVLRVGGFRIVIRLPPREHGPPHVHAINADGRVAIHLRAGDAPQMIRSVVRMRTADVSTAFWIVEAHTDYLLHRWRAYHG